MIYGEARTSIGSDRVLGIKHRKASALVNTTVPAVLEIRRSKAPAMESSACLSLGYKFGFTLSSFASFTTKHIHHHQLIVKLTQPHLAQHILSIKGCLSFLPFSLNTVFQRHLGKSIGPDQSWSSSCVSHDPPLSLPLPSFIAEFLPST